MTEVLRTRTVLVMGVGNTLLKDDGIGIHVTNALKPRTDFKIIDGGTIGLSLLPEIEDADAVIVVDASEISEPAGSIRIFRNREIDRQLSGKKRTVHEVALADLFSAAEIRGRCPAERALIAIQPASTDWGLEPTAEVQAAIPRACAAINDIAQRWRNEA